MIFLIPIIILISLLLYFLTNRREKIVYPSEISIDYFLEQGLALLKTDSYLLYRIMKNKLAFDRSHNVPKPDFRPKMKNFSKKETRFLKEHGFITAEKIAFKGKNNGYLVIFFLNSKIPQEFNDFVKSYRPLIEENIKTNERILEINLINELNIKLGTTEDFKSFYRNLVTVSKKILGHGRIIPAQIEGTDLIFYLLRGEKTTIPIADLPVEVQKQIMIKKKPIQLSPFPKVFLSSLPIQSAKAGYLIPIISAKKTIALLLYYKKRGEILPKEQSILGFISNQAMIILEKMMAMRNLNQSIKDIISLQHSAQALLFLPELNKLVDKILSEASRIIGFQRIILSLYNPNSNTLERLGSIGFSKEEWKKIKSISPPYFQIRNLFRDEYSIGNSYYIPHNAPEKSQIKDFIVHKSNSSKNIAGVPDKFWHANDVLLIPIQDGKGKFLGLISADSPIDGMVPDSARLKVFETFATLIGLGLESTSAFNRLQSLVEKLQSLHSVTVPISSVGQFEKVLTRILNLTKENFHYHNVAILLKDEEKNELFVKVAVGDYLVDPTKVRLKIGRDGVCGIVAQQGKPKLIQNTTNIPFFIGDRNKPRSEIAIPLRSHDKLIGILNVEKDGANSLNKEDLTLLSILGGHISAAIENALLYEEIERLSITDELTAIYNYRYLLDVIKYEIGRSKRFQHHFSIIMLDIDKFKDFNDRYGHLFGDQVLKDLAQILANSIRTSDIVTRYGGDEFVIVLPETSKEQALILGERLRNIVSQHSFKKNVHLSVSMGLASYPIDGQDVFPLIDRVDHMLYISKSKGGNALSS